MKRMRTTKRICPNSRHSMRPFYLWPNILSIDAALIAVCWQYFLGVQFGLSLDWSRHLILGAAVWLAYAADRWIDGLRISLEKVGTARHRFYITNRYPVLAAWLVVLVSAIALAHFKLERRELLLGWALVAVCLIYALLIQRPGIAWGWLFPKELWASVLFTAGVFFFLWDKGIPHYDTIVLVLVVTAFFLQCFANCNLMAKWESEEDRNLGQKTLCLKWPFWAKKCKWLAVAAGLISFGLWFVMPFERGLPLIIAFNVSGWALFFLDLNCHRFSSEDLRALGDGALFSPLAALAIEWAWSLVAL